MEEYLAARFICRSLDVSLMTDDKIILRPLRDEEDPTPSDL